MIRTFVDAPTRAARKRRRRLKERVLYATWAQANMNRS
jgi:hypothetical protein